MGNEELLAALRQFVAERNWQQFHTPENLAKSISIESAELLELFQWSEPSNVEEVKDELADVLTYLVSTQDTSQSLNTTSNTRTSYWLPKYFFRYWG
jgi:NTP pyrophosphatase (non-canonical NTP hydrolase)